MKDLRISIRLSEEEHCKFKILAAKRKKSMQELLISYVKKELKKSGGKE